MTGCTICKINDNKFYGNSATNKLLNEDVKETYLINDLLLAEGGAIFVLETNSKVNETYNYMIFNSNFIFNHANIGSAIRFNLPAYYFYLEAFFYSDF